MTFAHVNELLMCVELDGFWEWFSLTNLVPHMHINLQTYYLASSIQCVQF